MEYLGLLSDIEVWESSEKEKTSTLEEFQAEIVSLREQLSTMGEGLQNEKLSLEWRIEGMLRIHQSSPFSVIFQLQLN